MLLIIPYRIGSISALSLFFFPPSFLALYRLPFFVSSFYLFLRHYWVHKQLSTYLSIIGGVPPQRLIISHKQHQQSTRYNYSHILFFKCFLSISILKLQHLLHRSNIECLSLYLFFPSLF